MTDSIKLKIAIEKSGLKIGFLASKVGISRAALSYKINGRNKFLTEEMYKLGALIGLTDAQYKEIFFANRSDKMATTKEDE